MSVVWVTGNMTNGELLWEGEEQVWYNGADRGEFQEKAIQLSTMLSVQSPPHTWPYVIIDN